MNTSRFHRVAASGLLPWVLCTSLACAGKSADPAPEATSQVEATENTPVVIRDAVQREDGAWVAGSELHATREVTLASVLADPAAYEGETLRMRARIEQVCQTKGCWMIVTDGEHSSRVTFADYGFFVPKHVAGATVEMDVSVKRDVMDEETARHLASETEGEDPNAITGPVETVSVVATGVRIVEASE